MLSDRSHAPHFTVLTCTYRRATLLARVFDSLTRQVGAVSFEWLVVDDGSDDDTPDVVHALANGAPFPVRYVYQTHGHKKAAFNTGVRHAAGELLVALDDDDVLSEGSLARLAELWDGIDKASRANYFGVTGLCARPNGTVVGDRYPEGMRDCVATEMYFVHKVRGEKFGCMRVDVLRQFPFPETIAGFVPETLVWWEVANRGYLTRFVNDVVRVYYPTAGSLSASVGAFQSQAAGLYVLNWQYVQRERRYFRYAPLDFAMAAIRLTRFGCWVRHFGQADILRQYRVSGLPARALVAIFAPLGLLWYLRDRLTRPAAHSAEDA